MPARNKINDYRDCLNREPHKTIVDIIETLEKPVTLQYLLSILKPVNKNIQFPLVDVEDIEKLQKADIQIHTINILRQRLREILNILVGVCLVHKEHAGKNVTYRQNKGSENLKMLIPPRAEYLHEGNKVAIGRVISIDETIEKMKQRPDGNKHLKDLGKNPGIPAMIIEELFQKMLTDFEKKTNRFGIELKDFDVQFEVKRKGEPYYKKGKIYI
jgi:hypothetical protein